jgi:chorismate dehydratase
MKEKTIIETETADRETKVARPRYIKIGAVSFINTVPLIAGLEDEPAVKLTTAVPSALSAMLGNRKVDVALIPSIDYQTVHGDVRIIRSGAIGSLKQSLTVRLFCRQPVKEIATLACDTDSHTSVFLARIVLKDLYGVTPDIVRLTYTGPKATAQADAMLLIGDKVVTADIDQPFRAVQVDLVEAWRKLTGLGFVFAVWACRPEFRAQEVSVLLKRTLEENLKHLPALAKENAAGHGWPEMTARKYLSENMYYLFDHNQLKALKLFYSLSQKHGLIRRQRLIRFAGQRIAR